MNVSEVSRIVNGGVEVDIMVSPRSGRSGPEGMDEWRKRMIVKVKAPPLDGKANKEIEDLFKKITGMPCEIANGHTNRHKTVMIHGDPAHIMEKLEGAL